MARLKEIVFDSLYPASLARFWAAALEGYDVRPYDDEEIARLAALGYTHETDPCVMVDGPGPSLCFQCVEELRPAKGRVHLDVTAPGARRDELIRLMALGATIRDDHEDFTVMLDPEGNPFCVQDPRA